MSISSSLSLRAEGPNKVEGLTKRERIHELYREGKTGKKLKEIVAEIVALTGLSLKYVRTTLWVIRHPGVAEETAKKWRQTEMGKQSLLRANRRKLSMHQEATRPIARNHRQGWTLHELHYLRDHGQEETIREIALKLGRSYHGVARAGQKFGIDLRGNKMGRGANRFRGTYAKLPDPADELPALS